MDLIFGSLKNSYVEHLTPNVMVFGSRVLGRQLGFHEVMRMGTL